MWLSLVGAGSGVLIDYELTPGAAGTAPAQWPRGSALTLNRQAAPLINESTLVMVVHPHCPCSRASLSELLALMTMATGKVKAYVLFVRPPGVAPGWERTDLWRQAAAIPAVTVISDDGGREAARFGARPPGRPCFMTAAARWNSVEGLPPHEGATGTMRDASRSLRCSAAQRREW